MPMLSRFGWPAVSLVASWFVLGLASFFVLAVGFNEPFFTIRRLEVFTELSLAPVVLALWLGWVAAAGMVWRSEGRAGSPLVVPIVVSLFLASLVAMESLDYIGDLQRAAQHSPDHALRVEP